MPTASEFQIARAEDEGEGQPTPKRNENVVKGTMHDKLWALSILGLSSDLVTLEKVREAYRDLVKVWHPDRFEAEPRLREKAEARLRDLNEAFEILSHELSERSPDSNRPDGSGQRTNTSREAQPHRFAVSLLSPPLKVLIGLALAAAVLGLSYLEPVRRTEGSKSATMPQRLEQRAQNSAIASIANTEPPPRDRDELALGVVGLSDLNWARVAELPLIEVSAQATNRSTSVFVRWLQLELQVSDCSATRSCDGGRCSNQEHCEIVAREIFDADITIHPTQSRTLSLFHSVDVSKIRGELRATCAIVRARSAGVVRCHGLSCTQGEL